MRSRFLAGSLLTAALVLMVPGSALATPPCPVGLQALTGTNVVVDAQVVLKPYPWVALLRVNQYHKGSGPRFIFVEFHGRSAFDTWLGASTWGNGYFGLRKSWWGYQRETCDMMERPELLAGQLPAGTRPSVGADLRSPLLWLYSLAPSLVIARWATKRSQRNT